MIIGRTLTLNVAIELSTASIIGRTTTLITQRRPHEHLLINFREQVKGRNSAHSCTTKSSFKSFKERHIMFIIIWRNTIHWTISQLWLPHWTCHHSCLYCCWPKCFVCITGTTWWTEYTISWWINVVYFVEDACFDCAVCVDAIFHCVYFWKQINQIE